MSSDGWTPEQFFFVLFLHFFLFFYCFILNSSMVTLSRTFFGQVLGKKLRVLFVVVCYTAAGSYGGFGDFFYLAGAVFHFRLSDLPLIWCTQDLHGLPSYLFMMRVHYIMYVKLKGDHGRSNG